MEMSPSKEFRRNLGYCWRSFRVGIFLGCLVFVFWQGWNCWDKFANKPIGTTVSIVNQNEVIFPNITICPDPGYKKSVFNGCDLE